MYSELISHPRFFVLCKMEHLAGVLENRPQMRDEKLATSLRRGEPIVRFTSLPPLIQTPLVGPKPSVPDTAAEEKKEYDRIVTESGVPQVMRDIFFVIIIISYIVEVNKTSHLFHNASFCCCFSQLLLILLSVNGLNFENVEFYICNVQVVRQIPSPRLVVPINRS